MDENMDHLIDPCNHVCLCGTCARPSTLKECPICRGPVNKIVKIFCAGIVDDLPDAVPKNTNNEDDDGSDDIVKEEQKKVQVLNKEVEALRAQAAALRQQLQQAQAAKSQTVSASTYVAKAHRLVRPKLSGSYYSSGISLGDAWRQLERERSSSSQATFSSPPIRKESSYYDSDESDASENSDASDKNPEQRDFPTVQWVMDKRKSRSGKDLTGYNCFTMWYMAKYHSGFPGKGVWDVQDKNAWNALAKESNSIAMFSKRDQIK